MKLLAIDTTGAHSSVAIYDNDIITQLLNGEEFSHLQKLVPSIDALLNETGTSPSELDGIAVSRGPGSFTGIRIGMATAKGLAQIWNKPIIEVPTLASFAYREYDWIKEPKNTVLCPVFDAKRHQIYGGAYKPGSDKMLVPDGAYDLPEYLMLLSENIDAEKTFAFLGDGIAVYEEGLKACGRPYLFAPEKDRYQTAFGAARLGAKLFAEGKLKDCFTAKPEYLRQAEAERRVSEKIAANAKKFGTDK